MLEHGDGSTIASGEAKRCTTLEGLSSGATTASVERFDDANAYPVANIHILEELDVAGAALDGSRDAA